MDTPRGSGLVRVRRRATALRVAWPASVYYEFVAIRAEKWLSLLVPAGQAEDERDQDAGGHGHGAEGEEGAARKKTGGGSAPTAPSRAR
jgi:hypothetical protein